MLSYHIRRYPKKQKHGLVKGELRRFGFHQTVPNWLQRVVLVFGYTTYKQAKKLTFMQDIRVMYSVWRLVRMERKSQVGVMTKQSACGTH